MNIIIDLNKFKVLIQLKLLTLTFCMAIILYISPSNVLFWSEHSVNDNC